MKTNRLIHFLRFSFSVIYRGTIWFGVIFLFFLSPLWVEGIWRWKLSKYDLPANGSRILYDSIGKSNNFAPWLTLRDKSKDFPYKLLLENDTYTLLDSNSHVIWKKTEDSLIQEPDSIQRLIASSLLMSKKHQEVEIDSILRVDPEIYIVRTPKRYYKLEPNASSVFQLRMAGGSRPIPNNSWINITDWVNSPKPWEHTIQQVPNVIVHRDAEFSTNKDYFLRFRYRTWQEFKALPFVAIALSWSKLLLLWLVLLIGFYQFKKLFDDLSKSRYFSDRQTVRVKRTGWVMIGYFLGDFLLLNLQNFYARHYFLQHDFDVISFVPILPDHWLLLFTGLTLLVFAQLFRYGHQLKEESELTI